MPLLPPPSSLLVRNFAPLAERCAACVQADAVLDFGPIFLPSASGRIRRFKAGQNEDSGGNTLAFTGFPLSTLTPQALTSLLDAVHCRASFALFADFKVAERNIETPACLLMEGLRLLCRSDISSFKERGGLEGLLYAERSRFRVVERHTLLGGSLNGILAECLRG